MNIKYLKFSIGIFLALAVSRFIPHPPNFTSLLALSFYIPAIFGRKFIPSVMLSFLLTDLKICKFFLHTNLLLIVFFQYL